MKIKLTLKLDAETIKAKRLIVFLKIFALSEAISLFLRNPDDYPFFPTRIPQKTLFPKIFAPESNILL